MNLKNKIRRLSLRSRWKKIIFFLVVSALLAEQRIFNRQPHWVGVRSPRPLYLLLYAFILYTVTATIILIASQDMQRGILMFGAFIIPLYPLIKYSKKYTRLLSHNRTYQRMQN